MSSIKLYGRIRPVEISIRISLIVCGVVSILTTLGIVYVLLSESLGFFDTVSIKEFFFSDTWAPLFHPRQFGIAPLVSGTLLITVGSGLIAVPSGLLIGYFLSEFASRRLRLFIKPILEILAGIPTVVYGYFALKTVTPLLQSIFPQTEVFNAASAAIVVGIMIIPMVSSLCDDAMQAVPMSLKQSAYALGARKHEVCLQIILPAALSGVVAAFILALSRAIGETMAVTLAAGSTPTLTVNPLASIQTMTAYIVQVSLGDIEHGSIEYQSIFVVGCVLFIMTLGMNLFARFICRRFALVMGSEQ